MLEGALKDKGMVAFADAIDSDLAEALRLYVISEAQKAAGQNVAR